MGIEISSEMCADVYAGWYLKARIYAGSVKKKRVCNLGFAEVCGMKCLIYSAVLLLSVNDDLGCSNIDYAAIEKVVGLMNVP